MGHGLGNICFESRTNQQQINNNNNNKSTTTNDTPVFTFSMSTAIIWTNIDAATIITRVTGVTSASTVQALSLVAAIVGTSENGTIYTSKTFGTNALAIITTVAVTAARKVT
jgi:hypothetical protein